nr:nuclear pore complex protein NUP88 [Ipomoea batatas]
MRFTFDLMEPDCNSNSNLDNRQSVTPPSTSTPKEELEWIPLQNHPVFTADGVATQTSSTKMQKNLLAWDGASRLYYWDSSRQCLHRISVRLGEPDSSSVLASCPSKVLQADVQLNFEVDRISINRNGSAIFLVGMEGLCIMYLYGRTSTKENTIICRTVSAGSEIYFNGKNAIRTLQISWHPCSDTHLGILSSDSVFRIFDLSSALAQPEQEYYLQPVEHGSSCDAASICPVDFSFGGDHLWDKFSVFVLFSDGSVYVLCPVVPFGSVYKWESILELYNDANAFGLKSSNSRAIKNSNLAISWLGATFPELSHQDVQGGNAFALRAQPYALFDASVALQGPLRKISHGVEDPQVQPAICEGRAVSFLYNLVSKDSILVTAWSGGQLQIDALADEIQPVWKVGSPARLRVDSNDHIVGLAMISESVTSDHSILKLDLPPDDTLWLGHPPPLLRLAIVDLSLPRKSGYLISMCADPLMSERIYCLHVGGVDSVVLHFLPFTNQNSDKDESVRSPSVHPVLTTCQEESSLPSPLCGFLALSDSFGDSWVVGLTCNFQCIVLDMETWNIMPRRVVNEVGKPTSSEVSKEANKQAIISKELLTGPKVVLLPPSSPTLRSVTSDSIEGRATLHQYFKLFHENYVEYAHKVYFELQHHAPHLKRIIDEQHSRLQKAQQKLVNVEKKQEKLEDRFQCAVQRHSAIEERLQKLRSLPTAHKRSLSKAEQEFKSELDKITGVQLDALRSSIEALNARMKRYTHSPNPNQLNEQRQISARRKSHVVDNQMSQLKASLEKLSLTNSENTKKVKLVESALKTREA